MTSNPFSLTFSFSFSLDPMDKNVKQSISMIELLKAKEMMEQLKALQFQQRRLIAF